MIWFEDSKGQKVNLNSSSSVRLPCIIPEGFRGLIKDKGQQKIKTGIFLKTDKKSADHIGLFIYPTALAIEKGILVTNTVHHLDADNEIVLLLENNNPTQHCIIIREGECFCQGVFMKLFSLDQLNTVKKEVEVKCPAKKPAPKKPAPKPKKATN